MSKRDRIFRLSFVIILLAVAIYSGAKIFLYFYEGYSNEKLNKSIREEFYMSDNNTDTEKGLGAAIDGLDSKEEKFDRFKRLWDINADIVGWLKVPGTKIDYPVLQGKNNDYYLRRNINKEWELRGSIFMDYRSSADAKNFNTVIYGHNMKDGSMFGNLSKYKKESFFKENQYIEYDFPGVSTKWQIFSVYIYRAEDDFHKVTIDSQEEYQKYLKGCKNKSVYDTGISVDDAEEMLTLMTCTYEYDDARLVVHAKCVEES